MSQVRKLVLDVMKPHEPSLLEYTDQMADVDGIYGVNTSMVEMDEDVENVKVTVEGNDIPYHELENVIEGLGGSIHSVDRVLCGEKIIDDVRTPQD